MSQPAIVSGRLVKTEIGGIAIEHYADPRAGQTPDQQLTAAIMLALRTCEQRLAKLEYEQNLRELVLQAVADVAGIDPVELMAVRDRCAGEMEALQSIERGQAFMGDGPEQLTKS